MSTSTLKTRGGYAWSALLAPTLLMAVLVLPSIVWIFTDQRVWPWDPGYYGYWTMQAVEAMDQGWGAWLDVNLHSLRMMPPLITWLGQFFVPLRHLTGDLETALMVQVVLMTIGTLAVVYRTARRFTDSETHSESARAAVGLAAMAVCGGAPLFIGLSHHYLTEMSQCLAAAFCVAVAWRVERRALPRNVAYIGLMIGFAFLSKASSLVFVLPALTYIAVALLVSRIDQRASTVSADRQWLIAATVVVTLTVAWYAANWPVMATHFVQASVGAEVQNYWSGGTLFSKLQFWWTSLADGVALTRFVPLALGVGTFGVLTVSMWRLRAVPKVLQAAVTCGTLFALYLAGTIVAVVTAYALQVNEDPRYIVALIPIIALLTAWALATVNRTAVAVVAATVFVINAAMTHAYAFGAQVPGRYSWVWIVDPSPKERAELTRVIEATCGAGEAHAVAVGVSYPWMNGNAANFYAGKRRLSVDARCVYHFVPQDSMDNALAWLDGVPIRDIVIVPAARQDPENFANALAKPLAENIANTPRFSLIESVGRYQIYRRVKPEI